MFESSEFSGSFGFWGFGHAFDALSDCLGVRHLLRIEPYQRDSGVAEYFVFRSVGFLSVGSAVRPVVEFNGCQDVEGSVAYDEIHNFLADLSKRVNSFFAACGWLKNRGHGDLRKDYVIRAGVFQTPEEFCFRFGQRWFLLVLPIVLSCFGFDKDGEQKKASNDD